MYKSVPKSLRCFTLSALALSAVLLAVPTSGKAAEDLIVKYDQSELVKLPRPAAQIIVGNPAIADFTVKSDRTLVVTGKTFGITNIIVLDSQDNEIVNRRVLVRRDEASVVNLQRGTSRQSYNCTPQCNPSLTVGDDQTFFNGVSSASTNKVGMVERAADSNSGQMPGNNAPPDVPPQRARQ